MASERERQGKEERKKEKKKKRAKSSLDLLQMLRAEMKMFIIDSQIDRYRERDREKREKKKKRVKQLFRSATDAVS